VVGRENSKPCRSGSIALIHAGDGQHRDFCTRVVLAKELQP
jgi:hypothetical protein